MVLIKIQLTGTEKDKDTGFFDIMTSNYSSLCLEDEIYVVEEHLIYELNGKEIKYKIIRNSLNLNNTKNKGGDTNG